VIVSELYSIASRHIKRSEVDPVLFLSMEREMQSNDKSTNI
jgi:hypothetical protein